MKYSSPLKSISKYWYIAIITTLFMFFASPVRADWQYTKWGMTRDQVIKASKGAATPYVDKDYSTEDDDSLLIAPYKAGTFEFVVHFAFEKETHALSRIYLDLQNPSDRQCRSLWRQLISKYGEPKENFTQAIDNAVWRDVKANNKIIIMSLRTVCHLEYLPLKGRINKGL